MRENLSSETKKSSVYSGAEGIRKSLHKQGHNLKGYIRMMCSGEPLHYCNVCKKNRKFLGDFGYSGIPVIEELEIIGAGKREHVRCPICRSIDRDRFVRYILEHYIDLDGKRVLHFAPESHIAEYVKTRTDPKNYYSCDIVPGRADYVVDITDIQFEDGFFDVVICNHVLEHIIEEEKAVNEMKRVICPGGKLVLTVPLSLKLEKTIEDRSPDLTDEERKARFGQNDHVRIHGRDFKNYLESFGLTVHEYAANQILSADDVERMALIPEDRVFVCEKPLEDR